MLLYPSIYVAPKKIGDYKLALISVIDGVLLVFPGIHVMYLLSTYWVGPSDPAGSRGKNISSPSINLSISP